MSTQPPKLRDQVSAALRARHYPAHAEEAAIGWIRRFILFHHKRHPATLAAPEVTAFLASLTSDAERSEARTAILFLYRQVLNRPLDLPVEAPAAAGWPARAPAPIRWPSCSIRSARRCASNTTRSAPNRPTWTGSNASSATTATGIPVTWAAPKSQPSSPSWPPNSTSPPPPKIRPWPPSSSSYCAVLRQELNYPIDTVRARESQRLSAVLTKAEALRVIAQLSGIHQLLAKLLYGAGLRLLECLRLRVKDLDFERRAIIVRDTKGNEDRVTTSRRPCPTR